MTEIDFSLSFTPEEIKKTTNSVIEEADAAVKQILMVNPTERTFDNVLVPFHKSEEQAAEWSCKLVLASMVHEKCEIRNVTTECKSQIKEWFERRYSNVELFKAFTSLLSQTSLSVTDDSALKNLCEVTVECFKRNGVHLPQDRRENLVRLKSEISTKEYEFQKNLGEDLSQREFDRKELEGCTEEFIERLEKTPSGKLIVSAKPPHVRMIMENCKMENTRKSVVQLSQSRCKDVNSKILADLVKLRSEAAEMAGFSTWAEYKLKGTMAESPTSVWTMLAKLHTALGSRVGKEIDLLAAEKKKSGVDTPFSLWDLSFHEKQYLKTSLQIDDKVVKSYLPMQFCIRRVMAVYEYLFQIDFREISETAPKWHEDVYVFCVSDARSKNVLGYFYLDLFARAGKYAHQCVIPLSPGTGTNSFPVVANISNLSSKGDPDNPALLAHGELITFFHEFGHAVHALVGKQPYPIYSWSWKAVPYEAGVEIDFLEVPSKGFEFFAWEKDILQRATCFYKDVKTAETVLGMNVTSMPPRTSNPLPDELISKILKAKYLFSGYDYERMIFMTAFDLIVHSVPRQGKLELPAEALKLLPVEFTNQSISFEDLTPESMLKWWTVLQKEFVKMNTVSETNPLANWYHLAMGYDAGYYGYLWSETVAADIYKTNFDGNLTQERGMKFRNLVLAKEASSPAIKLLKQLLGRAPDSNALIEFISSAEK